VFAVDIASFRPLADFTRDAHELAALLKAQPRQAGFDEITLPGERSARIEAARRKSGIPIPAKLWEELERIAKTRAVGMPAEQRKKA
jgi:LDH2 family malate/lactate/ureidoglycolate dehydrogenase